MYKYREDQVGTTLRLHADAAENGQGFNTLSMLIMNQLTTTRVSCFCFQKFWTKSPSFVSKSFGPKVQNSLMSYCTP